VRQQVDGLSQAIGAQFAQWNLTAGEADIAALLLKGLSHKEIARLRDSSETTVRQQAASIYRKSGLGSRAELAAFFLEDLLAPMPAPRGGVAVLRRG
jgi:DNA-binding NarL/FixJ family response regulator